VAIAFAVLMGLAIPAALAQSASGAGQSVELTLDPSPEPSIERVAVNPATALTDGAKALMSGRANAAIANYSVALASDTLTREKRAILLNDRGVAYWRDKRAPEAITDFNKAVGLYPEYAAIYNNRGTVLLELGLIDEAIKDFDRAILLGPKYATAYNNRAGAHMKRKAYDRALDDYTKAASLRPGDAVPLLGRGRIHLVANRPFAAERDFTKGISLAPKLVEIYEQRRKARQAIGRQDGAFEDLNQMVALRSDSVEGFLERGNAYLARNQRKFALRDFDAAISLAPEHIGGYIGRARVMLAYRGVSKASEAIETALALSPNAPDAQAVKAAVLQAQGDLPAALATVNAALKVKPTNVLALLTKAAVLEAMAQPDKALRFYQRARKHEPTNRQAPDPIERQTGTTPATKRKVIAGAGLDGWRVVMSGKKRYFAEHEKYTRLQVPLEVYGKTAPRILDWEQKDGAYRGIGVLRYSAGTRRVKGKQVAIEQAAIVDLKARAVQGIEPVKVGDQAALWRWEDGALTVRGTDGLVNMFALRRPIVAKKRTRRKTARQSDWLADPWGIQGNRASNRPATKRRSKRRSRKRRKKKSLFDLIFQ